MFLTIDFYETVFLVHCTFGLFVIPSSCYFVCLDVSLNINTYGDQNDDNDAN